MGSLRTQAARAAKAHPMTDETQAGPLPPENEMNRSDALEAFVSVVNCCQPEHPHQADPWPITAHDVDYGVTRSYHARCGPRRGTWRLVTYQTRMTYIEEISRARHLALLTHEISHIPDTPDHESGHHPPGFWREMAYHALLVIDALEDSGSDLRAAFGAVDVDEFRSEVVNDPSRATVDRRSETVRERRDKQADLIGVDLN